MEIKVFDEINLVQVQNEGPLVSCSLWIEAGSKHDSIPGISHFLEHMLFKGTKRKNATALAQTLEKNGAYFNAFTNREGTCFQFQTLEEDFEECLKLLAEMLLESTFPENEINLERKVICEEINATADIPEELLEDYLYKTLFPKQNIGKPIAGSLTSVKKIKRQDLLDYWTEKYSKRDFVFSVVSPGEANKVAQIITSIFKPKARKRPKFKSESQDIFPKDLKRRNLRKELEHCYFAQVFSVPPLNNYAETIYLKALSSLLTDGLSSRLFQELREKKGLVYSLYSDYADYREKSFFQINFSTSPTHKKETLKVIASEINKISESFFEENEILRCTKSLLLQEHLRRENSLNISESLGYQLLRYGKIENPAEIKKAIEKITNQDFYQFTQNVFTNPPLIVQLQGKETAH